MFLKHFKSMLFVATGITFLTTGCSKVNDLYEKPEGEVSTLLPDVSIPSSFNWATSKTVDIRFAVKDEFEGKYFYKVEIFDREPQAEGANILAAGVAKNSQDFVSQITIPNGLSFVYVQQTTPTGLVSYSMLDVANKSNVVVAKASTTTMASAMLSSRGIALASTTPVAGTSYFVRTAEPSIPANATKLNAQTPLDYNAVNTGTKIYIIEAGTTFNGEHLLNNGITGLVIYVKGTWNRAGQTINIGTGNQIIVLSAGKLTAKELTQNNSGRFANYGEVTVEKLQMPNESTYENYGKMNVTSSNGNSVFNGTINNLGTLTFANDFSAQGSNAKIYTEGTFTVNGKLALPSSSTFTNFGVATIGLMEARSESIITNNAVLTMTNADFTNPIVYANCHTTVTNKLAVNGATINIAPGARMDVANLNSGGGVYSLAAGSILDVSNVAEFTTQLNEINGKGATSGVARMKTVKFTKSGPSLQYKGNLEVAVNNHPVNPQYNPSYTAVPTVLFSTNYGKVQTIVSSSVCNGGGFNNAPVTPPEDQTVPPVVLGTYSYAFEDNWPNTVDVDYDMNDLVVDIQIVKYQNKANKIEKIVLKNKIRSVGASKRLAAAIQLDKVLAGTVKSVTYSKVNVVGTVLPLTSAGIEKDQKLAVVTIVDDAHAAFGQSNTAFIFTHDNSKQPLETEITITFTTPLESFTYADLNPFLINFAQNKGGRNEVHLVGYKATDKINKSLVDTEQGANGQLSATDPFKTKGNAPFALSLPLSFQYPLEGQNIRIAYPAFSEWVSSGGLTNQNWYDKLSK